jgi:hypothetical protein
MNDNGIRRISDVAAEKQPEVLSADPEEILTVQQSAQVLKISYSHMLRLIRHEVHGMPPVNHVRAGRGWIFR